MWRQNTANGCSIGSFVSMKPGHGTSGGTGLGLAIAKWAVEVNGGRISVDAGARAAPCFGSNCQSCTTTFAQQRANTEPHGRGDDHETGS